VSLPERIGRLRRVERIGVGGFASVWLYQDELLNSPVAVKALADNWAARDDVRDRFLEEARILRRADSDHVVRVYDIGEIDATPYFVMSYADRGSLATLLESEDPLPADVTVDLIEQAGLGLDVLHRQGVIHRDIKPHNLLLRSTDGGGAKVLIADLGVAKAVLHASGLTQVVGTPAYMAPEQATGLGLDQRADVHALGAVAYQMITGRLVRNDLESVALGTPPLPPSRHDDLPARVDEVLLRALDPDPERRWPAILEFTGAFRAAFELQPPTSAAAPVRPATAAAAPPIEAAASEPAEPPAPSRTLSVVLIALLVLAASFGGTFAVISLLLQ
jgi:serine/threonine protein kinase